MRSRKVMIAICLLLCVVVFSMAAIADQDTQLVPKKDIIYVTVGKTADIRVDISPRAARAKGVNYESDNVEIATVNGHGRVTGVAVGTCCVTVASKYDDTKIQIPVMVVRPAKKVGLTAPSDTLREGESPLTLSVAFEPTDTTVQQVTFKSTDPQIATVDDQGVVTGVKAGKVSIVATAVDGSNVRGKINLTVAQPVTGVHSQTPQVRVGVKYHGTFTAVLEPKNATNHTMTWTVADPSIATVSGSTNRFRISGLQWGQTTVTGATEDGGFQVSVVANIGSLRQAIKVTGLTIRNGKPHITLKNVSNMNITQVRYQIMGYDKDGNQVQMSRRQNNMVGTYDEGLGPGDYSQHGLFTFLNKINYPPLDTFQLAITGFTTDTGYDNDQGERIYEYNISQHNWDWIPNS